MRLSFYVDHTPTGAPMRFVSSAAFVSCSLFILSGCASLQHHSQTDNSKHVIPESTETMSQSQTIDALIKKAKSNQEKIWDATTQRLLLNFMVPLAAGGVYILIQAYQNHFGLSAALMLIFYGLALVNASKFTIGNSCQSI